MRRIQQRVVLPVEPPSRTCHGRHRARIRATPWAKPSRRIRTCFIRTSSSGTFETFRRTLRMSGVGGRPEVIGRLGAVARLVGIEGGVVSGVINLESSGVEASDWRPRHDEPYHEV